MFNYISQSVYATISNGFPITPEHNWNLFFSIIIIVIKLTSVNGPTYLQAYLIKNIIDLAAKVFYS